MKRPKSLTASSFVFLKAILKGLNVDTSITQKCRMLKYRFRVDGIPTSLWWPRRTLPCQELRRSQGPPWSTETAAPAELPPPPLRRRQRSRPSAPPPAAPSGARRGPRRRPTRRRPRRPPTGCGWEVSSKELRQVIVGGGRSSSTVG